MRKRLQEKANLDWLACGVNSGFSLRSERRKSQSEKDEKTNRPFIY